MIWKPHVVVAALAERDGRFLFVEEEADGRVVLNQPAGHLDEHETLINAVIRETLEETAWHFVPDALLGVYRWQSSANGATYLRFAFTGKVTHHDDTRALDKGIIRALWLTPDELAAQRDRHRSPQVMRCVHDYLAGIRFPLDALNELA